MSFYLSACLGVYIISSVITVSEASYSFAAEQNRERRQTFHKKTNCRPLIQDNETYYSMEIFEDVVDDYWTDIIGEGKQIDSSSQTYPRIDLPFKFSFYGRPINHVFASTLGVLSMSEHPNETQPSHFIAPLFAHFINYTAAAFYESQGDKFVIEWREVFMNNSGPNLFQTAVFQNGTIMFLYKKIGRDVPRKRFMSSISSGLVLELNGTAGVKALIKYQPLVVNPEDIKTGNVVIFTPLSLCELSEDTQLCETRHVSFYCKHCRVTRHCPWSTTDKPIQQWLHSYCKNTKPPGCATDEEEEGAPTTFIAVVVIVVVVSILMSILGGWAYYAYNNPTTASGRWLIEHRPSQWKSLCFERTNTTKEDDESPANDNDDSLPKDGDISPDL